MSDIWKLRFCIFGLFTAASITTCLFWVEHPLIAWIPSMFCGYFAVQIEQLKGY